MFFRERLFKGIVLDDAVKSRGVVFDRCTFSACSLGMKTKSPNDRLMIEDVTLRNCTLDSVLVGPVVFDKCVVENLTTSDHLWFHGAAFRNCVFRGAIGKMLLLEEVIALEPRESETNSVFIKDNESIYQALDWAIDIKDAQFDDLDIRSIPAECIRVNNVNQIKVNYQEVRSAFNSGELDEAPSKELIEVSLEDYEDSQINFVLASNPKSSNHKERIELFRLLERKNISFT
jgi:hypothetical protein